METDKKKLNMRRVQQDMLRCKENTDKILKQMEENYVGRQVWEAESANLKAQNEELNKVNEAWVKDTEDLKWENKLCRNQNKAK